MGFFNFVKNIGRKVLGAGKIALGKGKDLLKTGVGIGNKILNNPISKKVIDISTPFLSATPIGRAALLGVKGAQKGLEIGEKLLEGVEAGERVAKNIQKVREGDFAAVKDIVGDVKKGIEAGKDIKFGLKNFS
jgi:hypothetical protein